RHQIRTAQCQVLLRLSASRKGKQTIPGKFRKHEARVVRARYHANSTSTARRLSFNHKPSNCPFAARDFRLERNTTETKKRTRSVARTASIAVTNIVHTLSDGFLRRCCARYRASCTGK
ncbi:unnamed protein product, partial [Ascophyllum nodosum]